MFADLIKNTADQISYSQSELSNIANTLSHLKGIVSNTPEFKEPFLGGSYKKGTMVKRVSDVDVYFRYVGTGLSQAALVKLKECLLTSYPNSIIRQDKPSILVDFDKIPINITPYKEDTINSLSIPDDNLIYWKSINLGNLELLITQLRKKNPRFIDLIKVLKLWNFRHGKKLKSYDIEKKVCNLFLSQMSVSHSLTDLPDWLWTFFQNNGFLNDAQKIFFLMNQTNISVLKSDWINFIAGV